MFKLSALAPCLLVTSLLALAGCGGGGSGGGGGGPTGPATSESATSTSNGVSITVDKTELRFIGLNEFDTRTQPIVFSISGPQATGTYFATVEQDANAHFEVSVADSSLNSMKVVLVVHSTAPSVDGAITFKLCKDEKCASVVWSRSIPYHIRTYKVDASAITLAGFEGVNTTITRAISPAPAENDLDVSVWSSVGSNWLSARIDANGALAVTAAGAGSELRDYGGTVILQAKNGYSRPIFFPVLMSLGAGSVLPADRKVEIGAATPAVISGSIALGFNGTQSPSWTAASDKSWLVLQTPGGTGSAVVGYTIDTAKLAYIGNFASDTASVTFKVAGMRDAIHKIVVEKKLPQIIALTPNPVRAGQPAELRVRGRGFQQLSGISAIKINNVPVATGAIISDSEAVITLGAMGAASYSLSIPVKSGAGMPQPALNVVSMTPMEAALIESAGEKRALLFSQERKALYTVDRSNAKLLRYRLVGANWINDKSIPAGDMTRIGLSHDGKTLYTTNGDSGLEERDPDTLAVTASYTREDSDPFHPSPYMWDDIGSELPITNDGRIWFLRRGWSDLVYFDTINKKFGDAGRAGGLYSASYAVSRDGSRMFVNSQPYSGVDALQYDVTTGAFDAPKAAPYFGNAGTVLSGDGKYFLIGATKLYESSDYRLIGQLPAGTGGGFTPALLSPDGSRIYASAYKLENGNLTMIRLDVIDAASMTKIGELTLPPGVSDCVPGTGQCNYSRVFTISAFGDTIFWAGNKKIAVIPIPTALMPSSSVSRFRLIK